MEFCGGINLTFRKKITCFVLHPDVMSCVRKIMQEALYESISIDDDS